MCVFITLTMFSVFSFFIVRISPLLVFSLFLMVLTFQHSFQVLEDRNKNGQICQLCSVSFSKYLKISRIFQSKYGSVLNQNNQKGNSHTPTLAECKNYCYFQHGDQLVSASCIAVKKEKTVKKEALL